MTLLCSSTWTPAPYQCALPHGHDGRHECGDAQWITVAFDLEGVKSLRAAIARQCNEARPIHAIAQDVLACAMAWEAGARLIGNVRADEIAILARYAIAASLDCRPATPTEGCSACTVGIQHGKCPTAVP